jgi:hypothetical protein
MATIRLENVQPGMELRADVTDRNGQLLARAGKVLGAQELRLFRMWGVVEVEIAGSQDGTDSGGVGGDPEVQPEHEAAARRLFVHAGEEHPFLAQLFRECVRRVARSSDD